jgi:hypothetical protein
MISTKIREGAVMGGLGSGRGDRFGARRATLNMLHKFDVRWLQRHGWLDGGSYVFPWLSSGRLGFVNVARVGNTVTLDWPADGRGATGPLMRITLQLSETRCYYGGTRPWFHCPWCGHRVAVLYGAVFALRCHRCSHRPYASQCTTAEDRQYQRVRAIRARLGASPNLGKPIDPATKPKGMHWRTWQRLCAQEEVLHQRILQRLDHWLRGFMRAGGSLLRNYGAYEAQRKREKHPGGESR